MSKNLALVFVVGMLALSCSKKNEVQEVTPLVIENLDATEDAGQSDIDAGVSVVVSDLPPEDTNSE